MKAKNASAGQDQARTDHPPTRSTAPKTVGKSASASSGSMSACAARPRTPTPTSNAGKPPQAGCQVTRSSIRRRDHNTTRAKIGTRNPCEYCGSFPQRSAMRWNVPPWLSRNTPRSVPVFSNALPGGLSHAVFAPLEAMEPGTAELSNEVMSGLPPQQSSVHFGKHPRHSLRRIHSIIGHKRNGSGRAEESRCSFRFTREEAREWLSVRAKDGTEK